MIYQTESCDVADQKPGREYIQIALGIADRVTAKYLAVISNF